MGAAREHPPPDAMRMTVGAGKADPHGSVQELPGALGRVEALVEALNDLPPVREGWWSPAAFGPSRSCDVPEESPKCQAGATCHRKGDAWQSTCAVGVDLDSHDHAEVTAEQRGLLDEFVRDGGHGANLFHHTPHGCRLVFALEQDCVDRSMADQAHIGALTLVRARLAMHPASSAFFVDEAATGDVTRWWYSPCAYVKGHQRDAEVMTLGARAVGVDELTSHAPARLDSPVRLPAHAATIGPSPRGAASTLSATVDPLAQAFRAAYPQAWPASNGTCPTCGHHECFGRLGDDEHRWVCFSASHAKDSGGCGVRGKGCWTGDYADVVAHQAKATRDQVLLCWRTEIADATADTASDVVPATETAPQPSSLDRLIERAKEVPAAHTLDDLGNAESLKDSFPGGGIRCTSVDAKKAEFLVWDAGRERWVRGPDALAGVTAAASELHARIQREMEAHAPEPNPLPQGLDSTSEQGRATHEAYKRAVKRRAAYRDFLNKARNVGRQGTAVTQIRTVSGVYVAESELDHPDRTSHLFGTARGVYDLTTGQRITNDPTLFVTRHAPFEPDFNMPTPLWDRTLENLASVVAQDGVETIDHGRLDYLKVALGLALYGNPARYVHVLDGPTSTVKSTMQAAVQAAVGDLGTTLPASVLCDASRAGGEGPMPFTASLAGRRLAFTQEVSGRQVFNAGLLKSLTGGEAMPARGLYGAPFSFRNQADIWITTNEKPHIRDSDSALQARIQVFPCDGPMFPRAADYDSANPKHRVRDPLFDAKLRAELPGILAKLITYAHVAHQRGMELPPCAAVAEARREYEREVSSPLERFAETMLMPGSPDDALTTKEVYQRYVEGLQGQGVAEDAIPPQDPVTRELGKLFRAHVREGKRFSTVEEAKRGREGSEYVRRWHGLRWAQ